MVNTLDRLVISVVAFALLTPFILTFGRVCLYDKGRALSPSSDTPSQLAENTHQTNATMESEGQPGVTSVTVRTYVWTRIWPGLGRFGHFGIHRGAAILGFCSVLGIYVSALVLIWFPNSD